MVLFGIINHQTPLFLPSTQTLRRFPPKSLVVNTTYFRNYFLFILPIKALSLPPQNIIKVMTDLTHYTSEAVTLLNSLIGIPSISREEEKIADFLQNSTYRLT